MSSPCLRCGSLVDHDDAHWEDIDDDYGPVHPACCVTCTVVAIERHQAEEAVG